MKSAFASELTCLNHSLQRKKNTLQIFFIFVNNLGNSVTMLVNFGQFGRPMLLLYCYFAGVYVESSFQTAVSFDCANL